MSFFRNKETKKCCSEKVLYENVSTHEEVIKALEHSIQYKNKIENIEELILILAKEISRR